MPPRDNKENSRAQQNKRKRKSSSSSVEEEATAAAAGATSAKSKRRTRADIAAEYENASTPPEQGIIRGHADNGVWSQAGQTPLSNITPLVAEPVVQRQQLHPIKARLSLSSEGEDDESIEQDGGNVSGGGGGGDDDDDDDDDDDGDVGQENDVLTKLNTASNSVVTATKKPKQSVKAGARRPALKVGEVKEVLYDGEWYAARVFKVLKSKHVDFEFIVDRTTLRLAPLAIAELVRDERSSSSSSSISSRSDSNSSRSRSGKSIKNNVGGGGGGNSQQRGKKKGGGSTAQANSCSGGVLASLGPLVASRRKRSATLLARSNAAKNRPSPATVLDSLQQLQVLPATKKSNKKRR